MHKMADPSARAALAAQEQGKYWEFHDRLFATKRLTMDSIKQIAVDLGLDVDRLEKDMISKKIKDKIQRDLLEGQKAGVTGTPTVFINGRKPAQRSLKGFQTLINEELKKLGKLGKTKKG